MPPAYEILLLNTAIPQIQAAQSGDTYVVPRDISFSAKALIGYTDYSGVGTNGLAVAGNVGIGTSSPGAKLDVVTGTTNRFRISESGSSLYFDSLNAAASAWAPKIERATTFEWRSAASGTPATGLALDSSGNLGLGTNSPSTLNPSATYNNVLAVAKSDQATTIGAYYEAGVAQYGFINSSLISNTATAVPLVFQTGSTERARISSDGTFRVKGLGTAGSTDAVQFSGSAPAYSLLIDSSGSLLVGTTTNRGQLSVQGYPTSLPTVNFYRDNTDANYVLVVRHDLPDIGSGGTGYMIQFQDRNGGALGSITSSGTGSGSTAYNTSSDYRLKNDVQPMQNALSKIGLLKPCTFKWSADNSDGQGFIAHELQEVFPEAVTGVKDEMETYTNDSGEVKDRHRYQGVDTSFLVATLTAAIQEQQAMINELKAEVAALKGN